MSEKTCETCRWWGRKKGQPITKPKMCRRYPPQRTGNPWNGVHTDYPITDIDDWCGEHAPSPTEPQG